MKMLKLMLFFKGVSVSVYIRFYVDFCGEVYDFKSLYPVLRKFICNGLTGATDRGAHVLRFQRINISGISLY